MNGIGLKIQTRDFPSRGRARVHDSVLDMLEISEGDDIDLFSTPDAKPVTVSIYADSMVEKGTIRLDDEDVKKLGVAEGAVVTAIKTPPITTKIKSAASETGERVSGGLSSLGRKITGKSEEPEEPKKP